MKTRKIKFVCNAFRWFDKVNGNTYHSVRITRMSDGAVIAAPFQYGYGSQYEHTALNLMAANKWIPTKYRKEGKAYLYQMDNNYPVLFNVSNGLKRDCVNNGTI